jgi:hypothetical protein
MDTYKHAEDLEKAFNQVGASMMTDDFACKLLAYLSVMGGGNEIVVTHIGLNAGIAIAQAKLNIYGGEVPKRELLPKLQSYIKELNLTGEDTPWLPEIYDRYQLTESKSNKSNTTS